MRPAALRLTDRRPSAAILGGAVVLAFAAAGGWLLGDLSRAPTPVVAADSVAAVGDLQLELEAGWVPAEAAPGPRVEGGQAFAPIPGLSARALFVTGKPVDASLVPAALRAELPKTLPTPSKAALGGLAAWTFGPIRDRDRMIEVTVVPTTAGTLALACSAPTASWSAALDCADGVHAIDSAKARALEPTAQLGFRQASGPVLATLDERRVAARRRLATVKRPTARAATARALAAEHRTAAAALAPFAPAGEPAAVVTALRSTARSYTAFAVAARRNKRPRFVTARRAVTASEAALVAALRRAR